MLQKRTTTEMSKPRRLGELSRPNPAPPLRRSAPPAHPHTASTRHPARGNNKAVRGEREEKKKKGKNIKEGKLDVDFINHVVLSQAGPPSEEAAAAGLAGPGESTLGRCPHCARPEAGAAGRAGRILWQSGVCRLEPGWSAGAPCALRQPRGRPAAAL